MTIDEYISDLREKGIIISVKDENVTVKAPDGAITSEIVQELKTKKQEILFFFNSIKKVKEFESIKPVPVQPYYPLSSAQLRMYFLYEFDKSGTSYNMPGFFRIGGNFNISRLEYTFKELVSRHQSLRTVFEIVDGNPTQRILDGGSFEIGRYGGDTSDIDNIIGKFVRPFDLSKEYPFRVSLIEVLDEQPLLLIDMHHIINDGVSYKILMRDFWSLYHGADLPNLRIQYVDYAVWQQSETRQTLVAKHKGYWLDRFAEEITRLELPNDYARPLHLSNKGETYSITLDKSLSEGLRNLANSKGVTMYTLFLTIYNVLLGKLSNQRDIVVGTPTAGRHHSDLEGIVGMFVNTLALRNDVNLEETFKDFLAKVQENTLMAFDHQLYQYDELVDALDLSRDTGRNPLFDVFFSFIEEPDDIDSEDSEIEITEHIVDDNIAKFDLSLKVMDSPETTLFFSYRTDLFRASTIARFGEYINRIIESILRNDKQRLGDLIILSEEERTQLLVEFNATEIDYNLDLTVLDLFKAQVLKTPDAKALIYYGEHLSYLELDNRSDVWANNLLDNGAISGSIVGLMTSPSMEMITGILAIMKVGAAYLPINPNQPIYRTLNMLEECGVEFLVTNFEDLTSDLEKGYSCLTPDVLDLDEPQDKKKKLPGVSPNSLAYVIYTSGSTGHPKGVMIQHESVANLIYHEKDFLEIDAHDKILQFSPIYFDVSVEQIWLSLTTGASLVLIDSVTLVDHPIFLNYLEKHSITHLNVTPSFLESLSLPPLPNLKRIVVSGEECKPGLANRYNADYAFYNEYGPTEATVISISKKLTAEKIQGDKVSIGRPIANTQAYVLDAQQNLLPVGVSGALYLGGKGLSLGYLNRLDLTQERFIENPFGMGRLYKTGDLARWNPDGTLAYLGRDDYQIKLRGYRIELGEIESQLENIESVSRALVIAHGSEENKRLIGYLSGSEELESAKLKSLLSVKIPDYMIPTVYIWMDNFPLTPNGKIDQKALPIPDYVSEEEYVGPETSEEHQMVNIWSEILELDALKIGINDSFFKLGGHSLSAIKLQHRISKELSLAVNLKDLFTYTSINSLLTYLSNLEETGKNELRNSNLIQLDLNQLNDFTEQEAYDIAFQQNKEFIRYRVLGKHAFNIVIPIIIPNMDVEILKEAILALVDRHEILRTVHVFKNGKGMQKILSKVSEQQLIEELSPLENESIDDRLKREIENSSKRRFDFEKDVLISFKMGVITEEIQGLIITLHHAISDARSIEIIQTEIIQLYDNIKNRQNINLPRLEIQSKEYAYLVSNFENSAVSKEFYSKKVKESLSINGNPYQEVIKFQENRYKSSLKKEIEKSLELNNRTNQKFPEAYGNLYNLIEKRDGGEYSFFVNSEQLAKINKLSNIYNTSNFTVFCAIFVAVIGEFKSKKSIRMLTPFSTRISEELNNMIGWMSSEILSCITLEDEFSMEKFVESVSNTLLEASNHRFYNHEKIMNDLDLNLDQLAPVFLNFLNKNGNYEGQMLSEHKERDGVKTHFNFACRVEQYSNGMIINTVYKLSYFNNVEVDQFWNRFLEKIDLLFEHPKTTIEKLINTPLLPVNIDCEEIMTLE